LVEDLDRIEAVVEVIGAAGDQGAAAGSDAAAGPNRRALRLLTLLNAAPALEITCEISIPISTRSPVESFQEDSGPRTRRVLRLGYDTLSAGDFQCGGGIQQREQSQRPPVWAAAASLPGGRALIAGGSDDFNNSLDTVEIFDPTTNSFSSAGIGKLGVARRETAGAELADGRVLVVGGTNTGDLDSAEVLSVPSNAFKAKLKGRKVTFNVSNEGTGEATDTSTKLATTAKKKKKKPKLVKTTTKHGGPGKIVVKVKLTKQGAAKLAQKGQAHDPGGLHARSGAGGHEEAELRGS